MSRIPVDKRIDHKQGDDWRQKVITSVLPTQDLALPAPDVRDGTLSSQIRDETGVLLATLECEFISGDPLRRVDVVSYSDTKDWPLGIYLWDVSFVDADGVRITTPTNFINVVKSITDV